ncbi:hypothetical protein BsIDN1_58750 [Bacillus safensis]|uniref:Amino acid permease/ SLC12A domain-containing protein n=1 Tax=Bacillus safensis TaxID=561879 RepID=A0A5S9MFJ8_BACIA|nr:hypothetical protein BsIDN1_58750 [Bacillus safensis]
MGFWLLTAFVVGNMVGSGIFMLPSTLAQHASPLGVTMAWLVTGGGVLMIALVFGHLSIHKPQLTAGPQKVMQGRFLKIRKKGKRPVLQWFGDWVGGKLD